MDCEWTHGDISCGTSMWFCSFGEYLKEYVNISFIPADYTVQKVVQIFEKGAKSRQALGASRDHFPSPAPRCTSRLPPGKRERLRGDTAPTELHYLETSTPRGGALLRAFPYVQTTTGRDFRRLPRGGHLVGLKQRLASCGSVLR